MNLKKIRILLYKIVPISVMSILDKCYERKLYSSYDSTNSDVITSQSIVFMVDGKVNHGGLSDRIKGAVNTYYCSKKLGKRFYIQFNKPFPLEYYLVPNQYNWLYGNKSTGYNRMNSEPVFLRMPYHCNKTSILNNLLRQIESKEKSIVHVYTNIDGITDEVFSNLFNELFKPSQKLYTLLNQEKEKLGTDYVSATFRFQQLLGDFKEDGYKEYDEKEKNILIKECIEELEKIHLKEQKRILVTSDSKRFLCVASQLKYVYTTPGEILHLQYSTQGNFLSYVKSFVDLFLLADSQKIYSVVKKDMLSSGFPLFASKIKRRPFVLVK